MPIPSRTLAAVAGVFFLLTAALGLALRWEFVTGYLSGHGYNFVHLRHAHSHGGYYVVLTMPLFWMLERLGRGLPRAAVYGYMAVAAAASVAFAFGGYNVFTIVLSTLVLATWIWAGLRMLRAGPESWLPVAAVNLALGSLILPPVALTMESDMALSTRLAHMFLTVLLLGMYMPILWELLGVRRRRALFVWELVFLPAVAAMIFDVEAGILGRLCVAFFGSLLFAELSRAPLQGRLRLYALSVAAVITAGALLPQPMPHELRIAGIHFLILGPVMHMLFAVFAKRPVWLGYDAALALMLGSIVAAPRFWPAESMQIVAIASTVFVVALLQPVYLLIRQVEVTSSRPL